jgi:predicted AAA+ superfamily ATPase
MKRDIEAILLQWKNDSIRKPLIIRGARQVGKSHTISEFGRGHFKSLVEINFELNPEFASCFESLEPQDIIDRISLRQKTDIIPGETLLFLDEIQLFPKAITALRYFYERMPALHVIAAGSLLEFALEEHSVSVPVGRVQYVYLHPLSFGEFLDAVGENRLRAMLTSPRLLEQMGTAGHEHALALLKKYLLIGGMPEAVSAFISGKTILDCQRIHMSILQTYRDDFGKYASRAKHKYLQKVFDAAARMVGQKFKYSRVDPDVQSREFKNAVELLEKAGVIHVVRQTGGEGLPLSVGASDRHFKVIFLDVGLMQNACGLSGEISSHADILAVHQGSVAEQFAGQQLIAAENPFTKSSLYYWVREAANSTAEVDYLVANHETVLPVEIKAGSTGSFRSMHLFLQQYHRPFGMTVSQKPFHSRPPAVSIPLYAVQYWRDLIPTVATIID